MSILKSVRPPFAGFALILALSAVSACLNAQDPAIGASIDEVQHGEHWMGPKLDAKALRGKVVLMEMWGS